MIFQKNRARGRDAGARGKKCITQDAEDPRREVGAGLEGIESAKSFGDGFLHEVFRLGVIAGEPESVAVERRQKRKRELLKGCAAGGRRHRAKCLGVCAGVEPWGWSGIDEMAVYAKHIKRKPDCGWFI